MKLGAKGEYVRILQKELGVTPDGDFGPKTEAAVKEWQKSKGLTPDGDFGIKSWSKLLGIPIKKTNRKITEVILHCSATKVGQPCTVEKITKWHKDRGFATIGYHYVIYADGSIHLGRDVAKKGAHATNHNANSIGICYIGGYNASMVATDTRTISQDKSFRLILACMRDLYPGMVVIGHRDTSPDKNKNGKVDRFEWIKDCPCFEVKEVFKI